MAVAYTKAVFLRGISMVYMFAFTSLYVQIPGLYGTRGILPAHLELQCRKGDALVECFKQKPTLLWFAPAFGLDVSSGMEVLAVFGAVLAFIGFVWVEVCTALLMLALWAFYYSLVAAGSTFMHFQWDILLLEAGFLAILAAPFWMGKSAAKPSTKDDLVMWMVRWLLFRLMFASGVVKLLSNCPTWWGLTALSWHYESQCIPTPLAWFAHQLPTWFQQLSTAATFLIEIPIPVLFFSPVRNVRLFAFYCQQIFQIAIMLTGNYNFFNILTLVLCVSLLDDEWFFGKRSKKSRTGWLASLVNGTIAGFLYLSVYLFATEYFSLSFDGGIPRSKVAFTPAEFRKALSFAVPIMAVGAALLLLVKLLTGFYQSLKQIRSLLSYVIVAALSCLLFTASLVPFTSVEPLTQTRLPRVAKNLYGSLDQWNLVNSYGLFRSMTGVGGRPEIIVEGADSGGNPSWKEIPFRYKPGPVDEPPPFVAPHQPRLDWQMWFAALSRAEHNPWLYSFVYRVLEGSPDVLKLLEPGVKPPKQIKVDSYLYHYTRKDSSNRNDSVNWWKRDTRKEYLKPVTKDSPEMAMIASISRTTDPRKVHPSWRVVLDPLRSYSDRVPPHVLIWSLLVAALCLVFFGSMRK